MNEPESCAAIEEMAAELAVGALSGAERGMALAHLETCARCRDLVDDLAGTADRLLLLAPVSEPPVGFESRVAARLGAEVTQRPSRRGHRVGRRWAAVAAAAALVAGLGGIALGSVVSDGGGGRDGAVRTAVARSERTGATCRAVVYGDRPAWLMVSLQGARKDIVGDYVVEAQAVGEATPVAVGAIPLRDGHGALGVSVDVPARELKSIRVVWQGRVLYDAEFDEP